MKLAWVGPNDPLPAPHEALREPEGLLAAGRDLGPARLLEAYRKGIFPWFSRGQPVLWWSPDPRMVLPLEQFKVSRTLRKTIRQRQADPAWRISTDESFSQVMRECAAPRPGQDGTWITPQIVDAYTALHREGHAHSVEVWHEGVLCGGLYGVSIGRMFYGESMFARLPDASKMALAALVSALRSADFSVIDCQQNTRHLASLGAKEIPRERFVGMVEQLTALPAPRWPALQIERQEA